MAARRGARAAAQNVLPDHEFAVVLADRAGGRPEMRIRAVVTASPFPDVAKELRKTVLGRRLASGKRMQRPAFEKIARDRRVARGDLPLGFARQPRARPARVGLGFIETDMAHRRMRVDRLLAVHSEGVPAPLALTPLLRRLPAAPRHRVPSRAEPQLRTSIATVVDEVEEVPVRIQLPV